MAYALYGWSHASFLPEERTIRQIDASLLLGDPKGALEIAQQALQHYSPTASLLEESIRAAAHQGDEKVMRNMLVAYKQIGGDLYHNRKLLETIAWGHIEKAFRSRSLGMRHMALLAAGLSQEGRGIALLQKGMQDTNHSLRALSVELAGYFLDTRLIEMVKQLFFKEKVWQVRRQVLKTASKMKIDSLKIEWERILADEHRSAEEHMLAISALSEMATQIPRIEIERLARSQRAALRQLVCRLIGHLQEERDTDLLLILARDPHPHVRMEALQALGQIRSLACAVEACDAARSALNMSQAYISIYAAWVLTLYNEPEGHQVFQHLLYHARGDIRAVASAALAMTGKRSIGIMRIHHQNHPDFSVRLNLALGLIEQRESIEQAVETLKEAVIYHKQGKWRRLKVRLFEALADHTIAAAPEEGEEVEDEASLIQLELWNQLAMLEVPDTQQIIRAYLMERSWDISSRAAALLLTEGDESSLELIRALQWDVQPRVRLHAALILALWGRGEEALCILEGEYEKSVPETKLKILEGIGRVGALQSVPFLIRALDDPFQSVRLVAALALLQCVNR